MNESPNPLIETVANPFRVNTFAVEQSVGSGFFYWS